MHRIMQPWLQRQLSASEVQLQAQEMPDELQAQQHTALNGKARATSSQLAVREPFRAPGAVDAEAKGCWQRGRCCRLSML